MGLASLYLAWVEDLPPRLNDIVERALNKDMEKRYQRGADLARELRAMLAGAAQA